MSKWCKRIPGGILVAGVLYLIWKFFTSDNDMWLGFLAGLGGAGAAVTAIKHKREALVSDKDRLKKKMKDRQSELNQDIVNHQARVDEAGRVHQQLGVTVGKKKEDVEQELIKTLEEIRKKDMTADEAADIIRKELGKNEE